MTKVISAGIIKKGVSKDTTPKKVSYNVLATVELKKSVSLINMVSESDDTNAVVSKNILFLSASSTRDVMHRIVDFMYANGYMGFELKELILPELNNSIQADIIVSVPDGKVFNLKTRKPIIIDGGNKNV